MKAVARAAVRATVVSSIGVASFAAPASAATRRTRAWCTRDRRGAASAARYSLGPASPGLGEQQFHEQVAIAREGVVVATPVIQPNDQSFSSFGGTAVISSDFTRQEARALAAAVQLAKGR